jgi:hypothetical protein
LKRSRYREITDDEPCGSSRATQDHSRDAQQAADTP